MFSHLSPLGFVHALQCNLEGIPCCASQPRTQLLCPPLFWLNASSKCFKVNLVFDKSRRLSSTGWRACCLERATNFQSGTKWHWHDSILHSGSTLRSDAMEVQPWAQLSWRACAAGSALWGEVWEDSWMSRKAHGAASLLHAWDRRSWSTFGVKQRRRVMLWMPRLPTSLVLLL